MRHFLYFTKFNEILRDISNIFLESNLVPRSSGGDLITDDQPEIPGCYLGIWNSKLEPVTNLHPKIVKFLPAIKMVKLNDGKMCKRVSILGSDGDIYHFALLQTPNQTIKSMVF